ncbi:MAG: GNAT family N-acetyltransferase [Acetivibrionales bacterium]|jgi:RimJ/RimL family protein N-acetyltransferase|nr:GNAT family N-acetyltransferase [Clostridiaceae bacterium]
MIVNEGQNIVFKELEKKDMEILERWYGMSDCFGYATGFKNFSDIRKKLKQPIIPSSLSFMIYNGLIEKPIGFIYGYIKNLDMTVVLWINIFIIDPAFQNRGFGTNAINKLLDMVHEEYGAITCIVSVSQRNEKGLSFWRKVGFSHDPDLEQSLHQFGTSQVAIMKRILK